MSYLLLKWLHVLSSTLLFGTGLGTAYYFLRANRSGDPATLAHTARFVVQADGWFTTPTAVLQPVTGLAMVFLAGLPLEATWLWLSLALYAVAGACWLPVVRLQVRMRDWAVAAWRDGTPLPPAYHRALRWWFALGWPAFGSFMVIFWLMVFKPA